MRIAPKLDRFMARLDSLGVVRALRRDRRSFDRDSTGSSRGAENHDTASADARAKAEWALRESEARYRHLFESIDEGLCILEQLPKDAQGRHDYRYVAVNPATLAILGVSDLTGDTLRSRFP